MDDVVEPAPGLEAYGWGPALEAAFAPHAAQGLLPGRVVVGQRGQCRVRMADREVDASVQRSFRRAAASSGDYPAVGDWLALQPHPDGTGASVRAILPRRSAFVRKERGLKVEGQVVAANVDVALLVTSLDADLNVRRLERYLALAWASGAQPVIVLNKLDTCPHPERHLAAVRAVAGGTPVHAVSARTGDGLDALSAHLSPGSTVVLLGMSGVGKSTIVNALLGWDRQRTSAVREDDSRGRHTTTARELIPLPGGAILVDTPGMRSISLYDVDDDLSQAFADIAELEAACRFSDCRHEREPGCAVRAAIEAGRLPAERFLSRRKLESELRALERRQRPASSRAGQRRFGRMVRDASRGATRSRRWDPDA